MLPAHMELGHPHMLAVHSEERISAADGTKDISTAEIKEEELIEEGIGFYRFHSKIKSDSSECLCELHFNRDR